MGAESSHETTLKLTRDFKADPERVFGAFLDPEALKRIWSTNEYRIVEMKADARTGGGWSMAMREEASGAVSRSTAQYDEIVRPSRIVWRTKWLDGPMAAAPEMRVTLEFSAIPGGTRVKLTHEFFPDSETRDHHGTGWTSGFDRLELLLAGRLAA